MLINFLLSVDFIVIVSLPDNKDSVKFTKKNLQTGEVKSLKVICTDLYQKFDTSFWKTIEIKVTSPVVNKLMIKKNIKYVIQIIFHTLGFKNKKRHLRIEVNSGKLENYQLLGEKGFII